MEPYKYSFICYIDQPYPMSSFGATAIYVTIAGSADVQFGINIEQDLVIRYDISRASCNNTDQFC